MSDMKQPVTGSPEGQRLLPHLIVREAAKAIDFYVRAFGAVEVLRLSEPGGRVGHAELTIDEARFMLADEYPEYDFVGPEARGGTTVSLKLYVDDLDAFIERAVREGAALDKPIANEFYGERVAQLRDPSGHRWSFATRVENISNEEMQRRFTKLFSGASE